MALKKPRKLKMAGTLYHWKASKNGFLHFAVRQPDNPKLRMVVNFRKGEEAPITPGLVRKYVEKAVTEGWTGSIEYWYEHGNRKNNN